MGPAMPKPPLPRWEAWEGRWQRDGEEYRERAEEAGISGQRGEILT